MISGSGIYWKGIFRRPSSGNERVKKWLEEQGQL
jgi:hypothetical protein